jgi:hypothetical protein
MSGVLTVALSLRASNVYAQTSNWTGLNVRISLILPDWDCFEEIRTEKAGLRGEINHTLDAYNGTVAMKEEGGLSRVGTTTRGLRRVGVSRE